MGDIFVILAFSLFFGIFSHSIGVESGYKKGQLDAIKGKIVYELVEQDNGESIWKKKKEEE